jgi:CDP-glucose 4,6-dehydratase
MTFGGIFEKRSVLVTGHTGFKGSWLAAWLLELGARVTGLALPPESEPNLFDILGLGERLDHWLDDVRDPVAADRVLSETRPDVIFHLAAQSLVRRSYDEPVETFATNVLGTVHLLDAVRRAQRPITVIVVTSDKCYENRAEAPRETRPRRGKKRTLGGKAGPAEKGGSAKDPGQGDPPLRGHVEDDPLGGRDPYSASKAAQEMVVAAYRQSFFDPSRQSEHGVALASVRAGNVIGGGDWAADRIVPDIMRALARNEAVRVRNPASVRPWQHVLDALSGYLWLASRLARGESQLAGAWNFGPVDEETLTVGELVERVLDHWGVGNWIAGSDPAAPRETGMLRLSCAKAVERLEWRPVWDVETAVTRTVDWHEHLRDGDDMAEVTREQIAGYTQRAAEIGQRWAAEPES